MTSGRIRLLPALLVSMAALAGCAGAPGPEPKPPAGRGFPVEATSCGFTSSITAPPGRAVTMNQGATEVMLALGLQDHMVGTAYLDDAVPDKWQEAYESVPVLSTEYPDNETLLAAEPDFVYASYSSGFGPDAAGPQAELEELGIGSLLSAFGCGENSPGAAEVSFEAVWHEISLVAEIFGVPERAHALIEEQQGQLDQLEEAAPGQGLLVFWFDSGDRTASAGAGAGGPQLVLDAVGASNVFAGLDGSWAEVSWEDVVQTDPDVIVLSDASWSTAEDKIALLSQDPVLKDLRAVKAETFAVLPFSATTPGVRLADGAVSLGEQLAALQ